MAKSALTLSKRVDLLEQELAEIKALLKEQIARSLPAQSTATAAPVASPTAGPTIKSVQPVESKKSSAAKEEGVSPEVMAVISAAVTHFLGLRARASRANLVQPTGVNPWAQQGRAFIQASHNLAHR